MGGLCDRYVAPVREDTAAPPSLVKVVVHPRGSTTNLELWGGAHNRLGTVHATPSTGHE
jgi:hypothetical protein